MKAKYIGLSLLVLGVGILIVATLTTITEYCVAGVWIPNACDGTTKLSKVCKDGKVSTERIECDNKCSYGVCVPDICVNETSSCVTQHATLHLTCVNGSYRTDLDICGRNQYCSPESNNCEDIADTCGDDICSGGETIDNCYKDCWSLSDWDKLYVEVAKRPELEPLLHSMAEFDFRDPVVDDIVNQIKDTYDTSTPYKYQLAVTDFVNRFGEYARDGGVSQCNEKMTTLIKRKLAEGNVLMNCVDYSVMMVGLLRHEGIPARMVAGCVSHSTSWRCRPYAFTTPVLRAGNIQPTQPLGHAWVEVWTDFGFQLADPTIGVSVGRDCIGYSQAYDYGGVPDNPGNVCYIPDYEAIEECKAF